MECKEAIHPEGTHRRPIERQPLGFGKLRQAHLGSDRISNENPTASPTRLGVRDGEIQPSLGEHEILRHALALVIHQAEKILSRGYAGHRGAMKPVSRRLVILGYALPTKVHDPDIGLRTRIPCSARAMRILADRL